MTPPRKHGQQTSVSRFFRPQQQRKRPRSESIGSSPEDAVREAHIIEITDDTQEQERHGNDNVVTVVDAAKNNARDGEDLKTKKNQRNGEFVSTEDSSDALKGSRDEGDPNKATVNPFAKFAFSTSSEQPSVAKKYTVSLNTSVQHRKSADDKKQKKKNAKDWIRMVDCSPEEQEKIRLKWHSLADPEAPLEVRRFQILVAARLHARCQEPVVRKTMAALRQQLKAAGGDLDASTLARSDPEGIAVILSSLQYYNTKAKQVVTAAKEILSLGKVPETEDSLIEITGIGPVMADLLAFINTVEAHTHDIENS